MESTATVKPEPNIIIILGATGDLTWRKLIPAIYNLYLDKWIPDQFAMIGVSHTKLTEAAFHKRLRQGIDKFSRRGKTKKAKWEDALRQYCRLDTLAMVIILEYWRSKN